MNNVEKLKVIESKLADLYHEAAAICNDCAHAIGVAEDTVINTIKFEKDKKLAQAIVNKNKDGWKYDSNI